MMNENIDIRMSNYMAMLSNPSISKILDDKTKENMIWALGNYAKKTSEKYAQEHDKAGEDLIRSGLKAASIIRLEGLDDDLGIFK